MAYIDDEAWYVYSDGENLIVAEKGKGYLNVPLSVFDEAAVMRVGHLVKDGKLSDTAQRALGRGSLGGDPLRNLMAQESIMDAIKREVGVETQTRLEGDIFELLMDIFDAEPAYKARDAASVIMLKVQRANAAATDAG